jgi:hypothetical protein
MAFKLTHLPEDFKKTEKKEESYLESGIRNISRTGARAFETAGGLPADIFSGISGLANAGIEKLTGHKDVLPTKIPLESLLYASPLAPFAGISAENSFNLPTSEDIRENITQPLGGEYINPQSDAERFSDEVVKDLVPLLLPVKGKIPFARALTAAGLGNLAQEFTKQSGGGEGKQFGAKIGTQIATMLVGPSGIKNYMNSLYKTAESSIAEGAAISASPIENSIGRIKGILERGISTPSKDAVGSIIKGIEGKIKSGYIPVKEAIEIKRNINEIVGELRGARGVTKLLPTLTNSLNETINNYGRGNPQFLRSFREAEGVFKGTNEASKITSFLQKNVTAEKFLSPLTGVLLGIHSGPTIKTLGALFGAKGALPIVESIFRSPAVRRYYGKSLIAAAKHNIPNVVKNVKALDKVLARDNEVPKKGRFSITSL